MNKVWKQVKSSRSFFSFIGLIGLILVSSLVSADFRTFDNIITVLRQASTLLILSTGLTAVLITGGMDLSVGATAAFIGCVCAQFLKMGVPTALILPIGLAIGAAVGLVNGFLVSMVGLPSFVATYATNWVVKGLSIIVMSGSVIFGLPDGFTWFGTGYVGPVPVIVIIALLVVALAYILLQKTTWGRDIYSYGSNPEAARYSAINVNKTVFGAFMLCSMSAAVGGLLMTARLNAAEAAMGDAYGLQTVAAVVIGGTSMLGGEGGVAGTVIGAILLTVIVNIMNLLGISSSAQPMVVGVVIITMVLIDSISRSKGEKVKKKTATA
ncbi:ABC transporter permease [Hydrogenoanaerobacterium sp.]|uniref:ABC transporter permease n=1 Tax=Hydrogenoanaerobacterium sp. TaxID=2953763 RepID=UPI00289D95EC|nr:ABC transporter permease [Hydrogenoanaerobacterium sp.]